MEDKKYSFEAPGVPLNEFPIHEEIGLFLLDGCESCQYYSTPTPLYKEEPVRICKKYDIEVYANSICNSYVSQYSKQRREE